MSMENPVPGSPSSVRTESTVATSATSLNRRRQTVVIDIIADEDDQPCSKKARVVREGKVPRNPKPVPELIECGTGGTGIGRIHEHVEKRDKNMITMRKMAALDQPVELDEPKELAQQKAQPDMVMYSIEEERKRIQDCLCRFLIEAGLSFSFPSSMAFRELVDAILRIKVKGGVTAKNLFDSRKVITERTNVIAADIIAKGVSEVEEYAEAYGLTLLQDGRSNINMDPLIATGVQGRRHFFPLGTVNAGSEKKDIDYLIRLVERYLDPRDLGDGLSDHILAICLDGASANISAMRKLKEKHSLITIRCQSHALSLVLKKVFLQCFPDVVKKATVIFDYVRRHQRVNALLKSISGLVLLRFIDTRFATHVIALRRLLEVKSALVISLFNHKDFREFRQTVTGTANKRSLKEFESVVADGAFWEATEFAVAVCNPITIALRMMDSHMVRAQFGSRIWSSLGNHLASELAKDDWTSVPASLKTKIYDIFVSEWRAAHYPVLSAAFVLDPANRQYVVDLFKKREVGNACPELDALMKDTKECIALVIKRRFPLDTKEQLEKRISEAYKHLSWYTAKCGDFQDVDYDPNDDADSFWAQVQGSILRFCARKILFVAITVSDVERLHKVYSLVHTSERNRLDLKRVDLLTQANLIMKERRRIAKPELKSFKEWDAFFEAPDTTLSSDFIDWTSTMALADLQVADSLQTSGTGVAEGTSLVIDPDHPYLAINPNDSEVNNVM